MSVLHRLALAALLLATPAVSPAAPKKPSAALPDFTKGAVIPEGFTHDWNLGPTGLRGWMFSDRLVTADARQIFVTKVDKGSPADGLLAVGDVIGAVGGRPFTYDPRTEFGLAITAAETEAGAGNLRITRWRAGKVAEVVVKLPVLGTYSATAPYDCPKSRRILERGCKALAATLSEPSYRPNPIIRSLNALALLASGDPAYLPLVKREAKWAADFSATDFQTWYYGYVMILLSEYVMATGDDSVMPGLRRLALEASHGQSNVGSWGHKFAEPDGRLSGYGMMNAPGVPLTTGLIMARQAGLKDPDLDLAITRSTRLLSFYIGKGAIPYGDHHPWTQTHEDNGKSGMASIMFNLLGDAKGAEFFSRLSVASHGPERDTGHTGNFFNVLWSLPAVAQSGPNATGAWMREFGAWYFDFERRWDGTFIHQGPPEPAPDKYNKWDTTGACLLGYAMPLKKILLTGRKPSLAPKLDAKAAQNLILDGRGWSNRDRESAYDGLSQEDLLARLGSWSPTVRERAAQALARRKPAPVAEIVKLLSSPSLDARYGACQALEELKAAAAPAIPALRDNLANRDLWLRIKAADAIAAIGPAAMPLLPELLSRVATSPTKDDPRGMEQRFLCFAIFGEMLKRSLDNVDRDLLRRAIVFGLQNEDGRARGEIGNIYQKLTYDEIRPLLPAIRDAIANPAPSGEMFADTIRIKGAEVLAKHRIREGMELCFGFIDLNRWGKQNRIGKCLDIIGSYGAAAKPLLPRLAELEKDMVKHREAKSLQDEIEKLRALIKKIESATGTVELRSLDEAAGPVAKP